MKLSSHHSKALIKSILQACSFSLTLSFSYSLTFSFSLAGMDPNWRHIIPPGQKRVISEGQCIEDCTGYAFPAQGINIFAVMMRTHQIGKEVKLRQVSRGAKEEEEKLPCLVLPCLVFAYTAGRQAGRRVAIGELKANANEQTNFADTTNRGASANCTRQQYRCGLSGLSTSATVGAFHARR